MNAHICRAVMAAGENEMMAVAVMESLVECSLAGGEWFTLSAVSRVCVGFVCGTL